MAITIAIVDWSWIGHHPTYFTHFAEVFAKIGIDVVPLCPQPRDFTTKLLQLNLNRQVEERIAEPIVFVKPRPACFRPARWRGYYDSLRLFGSLALKLSAWETRHSRKIDLVFFACIYDSDFFHFPISSLVFRRRWAGLYLHSFGFRETTSPAYEYFRSQVCPERFLQSSRLMAMLTLDEGIIDAINTKIGRNICLQFPDFTDGKSADLGANTIGYRIRMAAKGLPIIVLAGTLYEQRGINLFLRTAMANPQWFFALVGELKHVSDDTMMLLGSFLRYHPHSFYYPEKVLDDRQYNGIIKTSDVVWNIHLDWPGSSNTLTKAAEYEKPVVVSNRHLLGERVRKYRLGETCDETSVSSVSKAFAEILNGSVEEWVTKKRPMWDEFRKLNSFEHVHSALESLVCKL
jgi:hypothetical protein